MSVGSAIDEVGRSSELTKGMKILVDMASPYK